MLQKSKLAAAVALPSVSEMQTNSLAVKLLQWSLLTQYLLVNEHNTRYLRRYTTQNCSVCERKIYTKFKRNKLTAAKQSN